MNKVIGVVFNVGTWSHEKAVLTAMVATKSGHHHQFILQIKSVLRISSSYRFACKSLRQRSVSIVGQTVMLVISVIIITESRRKTVLLCKFGFKHQRSISVGLVNIINLTSIKRILVVQRTGQNQRKIRILLLIKYIGILGKSLVTAGFNIDSIAIGCRHTAMTHLTAFSAFVQRFDACLKHIVVTHIGPAVPKIILLYPGNISKAVIVAVMCFRFIFVMCQQ